MPRPRRPLSRIVPTTYHLRHDVLGDVSGSNGMWALNNSTARISVADSFDHGRRTAER